MQWLLDKLQERRAEKKRIKLLGKPARSQIKFRKNYPDYQIGRHTYGVPIVQNPHKAAKLIIGDFCSIANNVKVYLGGMHRADWITTYPFPAFVDSLRDIPDCEVTNGDVIVGSDVWLCANCVILSGVTVGHGAIVANSAIVTKDVPPYAVVGGNPARVIKWRFDESVRAALLNTQWWNWPQEEINKLMPLLSSNRLEEFLQYIEQRKTS